jgi:hypothetical protein
VERSHVMCGWRLVQPWETRKSMLRDGQDSASVGEAPQPRCLCYLCDHSELSHALALSCWGAAGEMPGVRWCVGERRAHGNSTLALRSNLESHHEAAEMRVASLTAAVG